MMRLGLGILAIGIAASALANDAELERLAAARARWEAAGATDYQYTYEKFCECYRNEQPQTTVIVSAGHVQRVYHVHENSEREVPAREGSLDLYYTIEDLFDKLALALAGDASVRVEYDATYGYPASLYIDYDPGLSGEETDMRLTRVEIL